MLRILSLCGLLTLSLPAFAADQVNWVPASDSTLAQLASLRPALKQAVTVTGKFVRIGDLVEHAGRLASIAIFRAPDPGSTGAVPTEDVLDALYPYGLADVDTRGLSEVSVRRASRDLTAKEIEDNIRTALAGQRGLGRAADLSLDLDQTLRTIHLEPSATGPLQVVSLGYDSQRHHFDIIFDIAGSAILQRTPLHLSGIVTETSEVLTLARNIQRGEIIQRSNLIIKRRPRAFIGQDTLADTGQAIGLAARRPLHAGNELHHSDLMRPQLVQRNGGVTLVYEIPGILLTVRGKALEAGAQGDIVSVVNLQSNRTVQGTVTGPGRIQVAAIGTRIALIAAPHRPASNLSLSSK